MPFSCRNSWQLYKFMQYIFSLHFLMGKNAGGNKQLLLVSWLWQLLWCGGSGAEPQPSPLPKATSWVPAPLPRAPMCFHGPLVFGSHQSWCSFPPNAPGPLLPAMCAEFSSPPLLSLFFFFLSANPCLWKNWKASFFCCFREQIAKI